MQYLVGYVKIIFLQILPPIIVIISQTFKPIGTCINGSAIFFFFFLFIMFIKNYPINRLLLQTDPPELCAQNMEFLHSGNGILHLGGQEFSVLGKFCTQKWKFRHSAKCKILHPKLQWRSKHSKILSSGNGNFVLKKRNCAQFCLCHGKPKFWNC